MLSVLHKRQRGDTMVEVLICIAVVGAILAGAFVVTNRSQLGVRDSQEHSEASKLVESQLEQLRSNAKLQAGAVFTYAAPPEGFCMYDVRPIAATDGRCKVDSAGQPTTAVNAYKIVVQRAASGSGAGNLGKVFEIKVTWASVNRGNASGNAMESMLYRLYP